MSRFLAVLALLLAVPAETGRTIYEDGANVEATVGGITVSGRAAACVSCHGDPRDGGGEGGVTAPPLVWQRLGEADARRPSYDQATLGRALREGFDSSGRPLHALMPHYRINDSQLAALMMFLKSPPDIRGVTADEIRIATILPPPGPLRAAGEAAADTLRQEIAAHNNDTVFGRRLRLDVISGSPQTIRTALADIRPLLIIGSVGLGPHDALAAVLAEIGVLNFAAVAAHAGNEDRARFRPLRPGLADQVRVMANQAIRTYGCVGVDAADDAFSRAALDAAHLQADPTCPARLILQPSHSVSVSIARARQDQVETIYISGEQAGYVPASDDRGPAIVVSAGGKGSIEDQARGNAREALSLLRTVLRKTGRTITLKRLENRFDEEYSDTHLKVLLVPVPEP